MTVQKMIEWLQQFDRNLPVVLNIEDKSTNSGVYISVCTESGIEKIYDEELNDTVCEEFLVLKPCMCHSDEELQATPESVNPN